MNKKLLIALVIVSLVILIFLNKQAFVGSDNAASPSRAEIIEDPVNLEHEHIPSIGYQTILENDEFKTGMQNAVRSHDVEAAKVLQQRAVEIATAANLPASQLKLLSGESGLNFMQFLAKRQLFSIAFEKRYRALKGIQDLKLIYPEAKDLFDKSDELLTQRDQQIRKIAAEMAGEEDISAYLEQAQKQWLALSQSMAQ